MDLGSPSTPECAIPRMAAALGLMRTRFVARFGGPAARTLKPTRPLKTPQRRNEGDPESLFGPATTPRNGEYRCVCRRHQNRSGC